MGMILAITPARGGSKGIPKKNIKPIAGKPLIAWTFDAVKKSKLIDRYVVSTEDREIRTVCEHHSIEVLDRPPELARDETSTLAVLEHAVKHIACDIVVLLQATAPIRTSGLIDECIREFKAKEYDSLATGFYCTYVEYGKNEKRRQDIKGFFYDDGNIYIMRADLLRKGDRYGTNIGRKVISRWENIDIDDEVDFWIAEKVLQERSYL
jgi:CMP-N-acetylneuraminic acid synthetase